jgi:hypothetical protein
VEVADLARQAGLSPERVRGALTRLGTAGRIGYDTAEAAFFHRELPYDAERAEKHNPRLRAAHALVAAGAVRIEGDVATVTVDDHIHRVRTGDDGVLGCTCQWWAKYRGGRGPCKHALAVRITVRATGTETAAVADPETSVRTGASAEARTGALAEARTGAVAGTVAGAEENAR